jgi:hypothetical protein
MATVHRELDFCAGDRVTETTPLPRLCRAFGKVLGNEALGEQLRLALRGAGLLTVGCIRERDRACVAGIVGGDMVDKLQPYLCYDESDNFQFVTVGFAPDDDNDDIAVASPGTALINVRAYERGRAQARADRRATQEQIEAEAAKWAPGTGAMLALAQGFLDASPQSLAARVARPISPACPPAHLRCPAGHSLKREDAAGRSLRCDRLGCSVVIGPYAMHFACRECDYDVCEDCSNV